jgi:hypothetical protein
MTMIIDGTNGGFFPSWTTATRPASPAVGQMGYNTTTGAFDAYTAAGWVSIASSATAPVNGPAFSAYLSADQSFSPSTNTKVHFNTEEFDTNSNYDSTTNYRFTPTVAGYYLITSKIYIAATGGGMTSANATLWKNGSAFKGGSTIYTPTYAIGHFSCVVSAIIYMNGSSDYAEIYGYSTGTSLYFVGNATDSYFQASMVRSA